MAEFRELTGGLISSLEDNMDKEGFTHFIKDGNTFH
jgi:hypothetical protein